MKPTQKMEYSINKGLWGTSIGGKETLKSNQTLPESAYPCQMIAKGEETLTIDSKKEKSLQSTEKNMMTKSRQYKLSKKLLKNTQSGEICTSAIRS